MTATDFACSEGGFDICLLLLGKNLHDAMEDPVVSVGNIPAVVVNDVAANPDKDLVVVGWDIDPGPTREVSRC